MGGSPHAWGVSRSAHQQKTARRSATQLGKMKAARHVSPHPSMAKMAIPAVTSSPSEPLPIVCDVFHTDILKLRSFWENQWAMIRPQGGHPMPESQPTSSIRPKIMPTLMPGFVWL